MKSQNQKPEIEESEKQVELFLKNQIETLGGLCIKWVSPCPTVKGLPDRIVIYHGRVIFCELKRSNGKLQPEQKKMIERIQKAGGDVRVIYGRIDVIKLLVELTASNSNS